MGSVGFSAYNLGHFPRETKTSRSQVSVLLFTLTFF